MKKERFTSVFRFNPNAIQILDVAVEAFKKSGVYVSRNSLINDIIEKVIYNSNVKIVEYEGGICSLMDLEGVNEEVQKQLSQYKYKLRKQFEKVNNVNECGEVKTTSFLKFAGMVDSTIIDGKCEYFISSEKLAVALDIEAKGLDISDKFKNIIIDSLVSEMCTYLKVDVSDTEDVNSAFKKKEIDSVSDETYYRLSSYRLSREVLLKSHSVTITKYMTNGEDKAVIGDLGFQVVNVYDEMIENEFITGVNFSTEEEALEYLSSCVGMDLRKLGDKLTIKEE